MLYFSKSKYCQFKQCPKACWLNKYRPELLSLDDSTIARMNAGNDVGDLAMGLFGDYVEVIARTPDGRPDANKTKALTKQYIAEGREIICEAAFGYNGLYCAVDILKKTEKGYAMYEVKSSTDPNKPVYLLDACFQKYVLEKSGLTVDGVYIVTLDKEYVFDGTLDLSKLFKITDISQRVAENIGMVEGDLNRAEAILALRAEPAIDLSESCHYPYDCGFFGYCSRNLPSPSVFDLYGMDFKECVELYKKGVVSYADVSRCSEVNITPIRALQLKYAHGKGGTHVDREGIKKYLSGLHYPLYFLDFETVQEPVPRYVGTKPFQQVPFQYSLHYVECEGGELKHTEFLGQPEVDPRRALAEQLVDDIPEDACVLAFNKGFERGKIKALAEAFPDLSDRLMTIHANVVDLIDPFRSGYYYNGAMGGSFSVKVVLPAMFPGDPELDYHNLEGVKKGDEAKDVFPKLLKMPPEERERVRQGLLKYCWLDTYAMVKIWQALNDAVK